MTDLSRFGRASLISLNGKYQARIYYDREQIRRVLFMVDGKVWDAIERPASTNDEEVTR